MTRTLNGGGEMGTSDWNGGVQGRDAAVDLETGPTAVPDRLVREAAADPALNAGHDGHGSPL